MSRGMRSVARWLAAALGVAAVATAAACGIPADDQPRAVQPPPPYDDLTSTEPPDTTPPAQGTSVGAQMEILYLTRNSALVEVSRSVDAQPSVAQLVEDLADAPTTEEQAQGLGTALTVDAIVVGVEVRDGVASVALGDGLPGLAGSAQLLAIAQIVCTLDAHPDVNSVVFTQDGEPATVPRGDNSSTDEPVTADAYASLLESNATAAPPPS